MVARPLTVVAPMSLLLAAGLAACKGKAQALPDASPEQPAEYRGIAVAPTPPPPTAPPLNAELPADASLPRGWCMSLRPALSRFLTDFRPGLRSACSVDIAGSPTTVPAATTDVSLRILSDGTTEVAPTDATTSATSCVESQLRRWHFPPDCVTPTQGGRFEILLSFQPVHD